MSAQARAVGADDVEVVVVAYRSRPQLEQLLEGLPDALGLVVVDNSDDAATRELVEARPGARYLVGGGVGYARAANAGARSSVADHLVFVNPDTRPTASQLSALVDDLRADPLTASSAALLVGRDGRAEIGAAGWEPDLRRSAVHALGLHLLRPERGLYARPVVGRPAPRDLGWTSGGVMAVRRSTLLSLGAFDEDFYVYGEDVAFGRAARAAGMIQVLRTDLPVPSASGGSGAPSLEMMRLRGASFRRYATKHAGGGRAVAMAAVVAAGYLGRAAAQCLRGRSGRAREHAAWAVGALTGRASVAGRVVTEPLGRRT